MSTDLQTPTSSASEWLGDHATSSEYRGSKRPNVSVFKNANNTHIENSSFNVSNTTNVYASGVSVLGLQKLYDRVSQHAILNAGGRADEAKCYPGTRKEIIRLIERWMDGKDDAAPNMMWLSGPAGAGKSAIVQTIAERCKERGVQAANFFFFRADPTRSTSRPLVATLLYQIFKLCPPLRHAIATIISDEPLLLDASIQDQFNQLLSLPLQDFQPLLETPARRPIVLLVDGLDECDSERKTPQRQILQALDHLLMQNNCPFLVLVASRAEAHITMAVKELSSSVQSIFLDDQYQPEKDIRMFVTSEFHRIKKTHHLAHTLGESWPPDEDAESIVKKSSGQFIFAATVMRYLANSPASPKLSLERVQGISPITTNSPFAYLDAIYNYIFSQVDDRGAVMDRLSAKLLCDSISVSRIVPIKQLLCAYNPRYTPELLRSCGADLTAILRFDRDELYFYHASLPDFLRDQSRAGEHYIDAYAFGLKILPILWTKLKSRRSVSMGLILFTELKAPTPDIMEVFQTIPPCSSMVLAMTVTFDLRDSFLKSIHTLYYPHDVKIYKKIMRRWVSCYVGVLSEQDLNRLESRSLPYVTTYIRISKIEYWFTRTLKHPFCVKR